MDGQRRRIIHVLTHPDVQVYTFIRTQRDFGVVILQTQAKYGLVAPIIVVV